MSPESVDVCVLRHGRRQGVDHEGGDAVDERHRESPVEHGKRMRHRPEWPQTQRTTGILPSDLIQNEDVVVACGRHSLDVDHAW